MTEIIEETLENVVIGPNDFTKNKIYNAKHREAQQRYREKNRDKYNEFQRALYQRLHESEEWKTRFNERSKKNNLIYRNKKKEELLKDPSYVAKKRGRPRKNESIASESI